jgi:hypothetical protein
MENEKDISKQNRSELLESLESWFSDSVLFDKNWKDISKEMYKKYHGTQWTEEEREVLRQRKQALSTFNHIAPAIDSIVGGERMNRPKVKMAGRTLDDEQLAEVKTNLYDFIQYNSKTDDELDKMIIDCLVAGRGTMYIEPKIYEDKSEILHQYMDYRDVFIDPLSKRDDLNDCRYVHYAVFVDEDILDKNFSKFKKEEQVSENIYSFESSSEDEMWYEHNNRKRPRLITTWYMDEKGDTSMAIWVKGKILYSKKKPYELNEYPFVQITYKRNLDNAPYGLVKSMVSAQEEINKRHSKALHYLNSSQVLAEENAFVDWEEAKKTLADPSGITKLQDGALGEGRVQVMPTAQLADAHIKMMQIAEQKLLSSAGINPAYVGQSGQYESAKKANLSINQAQNTLIPFLNKVRIARYLLAEKTMKLVPEFFTDEQLVRILNEDGSYGFMPINSIQVLDDGTLNKINDITADDVDVIIEDAPKGLNEKQEQLQMLLQIQGQTSRPIPMEILLRYTDLKDKHQLSKELEKHYSMEAQLQQAQQVIEQLQQQLQQAGGMLQQKDSQITQVQSARAVDKEVSKAKEKLTKELGI